MQLPTQYSSTQRNCRSALRRLSEDDNKIRRLRQLAGRGAEDAYLQLEELQAIGGRIESMNQHCVRYPDTMKQNMHYHIRALWNLSQEAARQALQQRIRHTEVSQIKQLLEDTELRRQGHIFCLRKKPTHQMPLGLSYTQSVHRRRTLHEYEGL